MRSRNTRSPVSFFKLGARIGSGRGTPTSSFAVGLFFVSRHLSLFGSALLALLFLFGCTESSCDAARRGGVDRVDASGGETRVLLVGFEVWGVKGDNEQTPGKRNNPMASLFGKGLRFS